MFSFPDLPSNQPARVERLDLGDGWEETWRLLDLPFKVFFASEHGQWELLPYPGPAQIEMTKEQLAHWESLTMWLLYNGFWDTFYESPQAAAEALRAAVANPAPGSERAFPDVEDEDAIA